ALARLAVPAHRQVRAPGGLQPVDQVQDDLALLRRYLVVHEFAATGRTPPHPQLRLVRHAGSLLTSAPRRRPRATRRARSTCAAPRSGTAPAGPPAPRAPAARRRGPR